MIGRFHNFARHIPTLKRVNASLLFIFSLFPGGSWALMAQTVNIPGTHIFISAPAGYKTSQSFKGMEKNNNTFIKVFDPYNNNFLKYSETFTRLSLENGGSEVQEYKKLNVSGFPAKYASVQNNIGGTSDFLVFGDSSTVMLMASCPANKDSDMQQLKTALLSVKYSKDMKIDPLSATFFNMNDSNSSYRFAKCSNEYYIYSSLGVVKDAYAGESIVSVLPFTSEYGVGDETIARAITSSYLQYGITDTKIKKEAQVQIGALNAMEAEVDARIDNKKAGVIQAYAGQRKESRIGAGYSNFRFRQKHGCLPQPCTYTKV